MKVKRFENLRRC